MNKLDRKAITLIVLLFIYPSLVYHGSTVVGQPAQESNIYVFVSIRNYFENNPINNLTMSLKIASKNAVSSIEIVTNSSGSAMVNVPQSIYAGRRIPPVIQKIVMKNIIYVPIQINDIFLEEKDISGTYNPVTNITEIDLNIPCQVARVKNKIIIGVKIFLAEGIYVNLTDYDPFTESKKKLTVTPSLKVIGKSTQFESQYVFPKGYPVLVKVEEDGWKNRFSVSFPNTTISITKIVTMSRALSQIEEIEDGIIWLSDLGYPIDTELEQLGILKYLFMRSLYFLEKKDYESFRSIMNTFIKFQNQLSIKSDNLKKGLLIAFISLIVLMFGFTAVISMIFFENKKYRDIIKILFFMALFTIILSLDPSSRVSVAYMLMLLGVNIFELDYLSIIAASIVFGALAYFIYFFISFYMRPASKSAIVLAVRYLKAKKLRTVLTIFTLTLLSASTVLAVGIDIESVFYEENIAWNYGFEGGVIVFDTMPRYIDEIIWILKTLNVSDFSMVRIESTEYVCSGLLLDSFTRYDVQLVGINASFFKRYLNYTSYLVGTPITNNTRIINIPRQLSDTLKLGETPSIWLVAVSETSYEYLPVKQVAEDSYVGGMYDENKMLPIFNMSGEEILPKNFPTYVFISEDELPPIDYPIRAVFFATSLTEDKIDFLKRISSFLNIKVYLSNGKMYYKPTLITLKGLTSTIISVLFSSMLIMITMYGSIEYEKNDLRTIAILGGNPRDIAQQILLEGIIIGFISTFIGCFSSPLLMLLFQNSPLIANMQNSRRFYMTIDSIYISLLVGAFSSIIGSYIPAIKMKEASLFSREEKKVLSPEDLRIVQDEAVYQLPLRTSIFELNTLYRFLREEIVSPKELLREEVSEDGLFRIYISVTAPDTMPITITLRAVKKADDLLIELAIPKEYRYYMRLSETLRKVEEKILKYAEWKEKRIRYMLIRREKPKAAKPFDILLKEAMELYQKYRQLKEKLDRLNKIRHTISPKTYKMYNERYNKDLSRLLTRIRGYSLKLEPYYEETRKQIREISGKMEEIEVAYKLGEISENEYLEKITPLRKRIEELKITLDKISQVKSALASRR